MPDPVSPSSSMPNAIRIIRANLCNPLLRPAAVAADVGLRLPVFCHAFKRAMGLTCTEYIASQRIRLAKKMLREDNLLVKEIAYRVGYADPSYFSRRFRQIEGRPPTSYRRLNHRGSSVPLTPH